MDSARKIIMRFPTPPLARCAPPRMLDPAGAWAWYEAAAESNSLATDIATNGAIHILSDTLAQATERTPWVNRATPTPTSGSLDWARVFRFGAFGAADGAVSHGWFWALDSVVGESGTLTETLIKVAADQLVYTPLFCVWFLAAFVVLEGRPAGTIPKVIRAEWLELFRGNAGFFLPLTAFIYGLVPRDERVLAFGAGSLVYTWILSLWNSARGEARSGAHADSGEELCYLGADKGVLAETDCKPVQVPARSRALLSVGVRRALVKAKRRRTQLPTMRAPTDSSDAARQPPRLDRWTQLEDGRFRGEIVGGQILWIHAADVVASNDGQPSRIRSLNGELFHLGDRLEAASERRGLVSPSAPSISTTSTSLYAMAARPQSKLQRALTFISGIWPTLTVFAIFALSSHYGVVPGTCIGPAATMSSASWWVPM